jgi:hypothetical protein
VKGKRFYVFAYSSSSTWVCHIASKEGERYKKQPLCGTRISEHHKEVDTEFPVGYSSCKRCEKHQQGERFEQCT